MNQHASIDTEVVLSKEDRRDDRCCPRPEKKKKGKGKGEARQGKGEARQGKANDV